MADGEDIQRKDSVVTQRGRFYWLLKNHITVDGDSFNRWRVPPASVAIHLCIGSVYAWSVFNEPLTRLDGVISPSSQDWSLSAVVNVFSVAIVCLGLSAAVAGKWLEKVGPRLVGLVAGLLWGSGFLISSFGISARKIWVLYLGYGVLGGAGLGLAYVSPVSTLIRRGMATGMAIMGFGGGAMIGTPLSQSLLSFYGVSPTRLGSIAELEDQFVIGEDGVRRIDGKEVVLAGNMNNTDLLSHKSVHVDMAHKTPQFWLLFVVLCFNVTAGIGVIGVAKTMVKDVFSGIPGAPQPWIYVTLVSLFNMLGRFVWASASDWIGRKNTYHVFFALGVCLYCLIPSLSAWGTFAALVCFYADTMLIFTMYGGGFATIPAYLADIFGTMHVGAIHGRLLVAWSLAGVLGPVAITFLRTQSEKAAIGSLAKMIGPEIFFQRFGVSIDNLEQLIVARTVTIPLLMEVAPEGTMNPTAGLYDTTMYLMAGLLGLALIANALVKPVHPKYHHNPAPPPAIKDEIEMEKF